MQDLKRALPFVMKCPCLDCIDRVDRMIERRMDRLGFDVKIVDGIITFKTQEDLILYRLMDIKSQICSRIVTSHRL